MNDLFAFFDAMNIGDFQFVTNMTDEEVKKISPFVLLMWVNGAVSDTEMRVVMTNSFVNEHVFGLAKHPRLLLKMFIASNQGLGDSRYKYKKSVSGEQSASIKLIAKYYNITYNHARDYLPMLGKDDIKELKDIYG
jgi:hypothetical protein